MARAWNSSTELHTVTTIGAAKSVARKWAQNLLVHWTLSDLFPDGKEKKTLVIKSIIYLTKFIFLYIFYIFTFRYCKNKSLRLSDTVSLKKQKCEIYNGSTTKNLIRDRFTVNSMTFSQSRVPNKRHYMLIHF